MKEKGKEDDNGEEEVEWDEEEREGWEEKMREIEGKIFWLILRLLDSVPDYFEVFLIVFLFCVSYFVLLMSLTHFNIYHITNTKGKTYG